MSIQSTADIAQYCCVAPTTLVSVNPSQGTSFVINSDLHFTVDDIKFTISKSDFTKIAKVLLDSGLASADFENAIRISKHGGGSNDKNKKKTQAKKMPTT